MTNNNIDIKKIVAGILNIPDDDNWKIVDSKENIVIIHHSNDAEQKKYGMLKGLVIDVKEKKIICSGSKIPTKIILDKLEVDEEGILKGVDISSNSFEINMKNAKIYEGYEGSLLNIFNYNDKDYMTTARRLDGNNKLGSGIKSQSFKEMFEYMGGDKINFYKNKKSCCHKFYIVNDETAVASRRKDKNFLLYLGDDMDEIENKNDIVKVPLAINIDQANHILKYGYDSKEDEFNEDYRLQNGEFIIVNTEDGESYMIKSRSYSYRENLIGNNNNLLFRFYHLTSAAVAIKNIEKDSEKLKDYIKRYPLLKISDTSSEKLVDLILNKNKIISSIKTLDPIKDEIKYDRAYLIQNVWLNFLLAIPSERQKTVVLFYHIYTLMLSKVSKALLTLYKNVNYKTSSYSPRIIKLVDDTTRFAEEKVIQNIKDKSGKILSFDSLFLITVKNLLSKEEGISLYKIIVDVIEKENSAGKNYTSNDFEYLFLLKSF